MQHLQDIENTDSKEYFPCLNGLYKNVTLIFSACFCCDSGFSLGEMDQKFEFGGTVVYGDSYLQFLFSRFKKLRLQAELQDAAVARRAHSGKGPGYCYMVG